MGLINGLFKVVLTAGAVYAASKIADRYKEENPDRSNATTEEKISAVKQAAGEVYAEAAEFVKEKAPGVQEAVSEAVQKASDFASEKMPGVTEKVQEVVEKVAEKAPGVAEKVQAAVDKVVDKVSDYADSVTEKTAEESFDEVVDADFEPVDEEENK